jgi:hypothetical protein
MRENAAELKGIGAWQGLVQWGYVEESNDDYLKDDCKSSVARLPTQRAAGNARPNASRSRSMMKQGAAGTRKVLQKAGPAIAALKPRATTAKASFSNPGVVSPKSRVARASTRAGSMTETRRGKLKAAEGEDEDLDDDSVNAGTDVWTKWEGEWKNVSAASASQCRGGCRSIH